jgi:hypothetical protein
MFGSCDQKGLENESPCFWKRFPLKDEILADKDTFDV